jgi:hypothetical protein
MGFQKLLVLMLVGFTAALAIAIPSQSHAIAIVSDGGANESNSLGDTIAIAKNPSWFGPLDGSSWVSFGETGNPSAPGFFVVANNTIVSFFETVAAPAGSPVSGTLTVLADDSTSVLFNGTLLFPEAPPNTYTICSDVPIGCLETTQMTVAFAGLTPATGVNTFQFDVAQRNVVSFGLDYAGVINVPEPGTMLLLGSGLLGLGTVLRRRASRQD